MLFLASYSCLYAVRKGLEGLEALLRLRDVALAVLRQQRALEVHPAEGQAHLEGLRQHLTTL